MVSNVSSSSIPHTTDAPNKKQSLHLSSGKPIALPSRILSLIWDFRPHCSYLAHSGVCKDWKGSVEAHLKLKRNSQDLMIATIGRMLLKPSVSTLTNLPVEYFPTTGYLFAHGFKTVLQVNNDNLSHALFMSSSKVSFGFVFFSDKFFKLSDSHFAIFHPNKNGCAVMAFFKIEGPEKIICEKEIEILKWGGCWQWKDDIFIIDMPGAIKRVSFQSGYEITQVVQFLGHHEIRGYHSNICFCSDQTHLYAYKYNEKKKVFKRLWITKIDFLFPTNRLHSIRITNHHVITFVPSTLDDGDAEDTAMFIYDSLTGTRLFEEPIKSRYFGILFEKFLFCRQIYYIPTGFKFDQTDFNEPFYLPHEFMTTLDVNRKQILLPYFGEKKAIIISREQESPHDP